MKVLCIGDLHCREIWKDIVVKERDSCDKIVFLGNYTYPMEVMDDPTDASGFLYEVLDFKDYNPDKVVLLRGNYDLNSLGYSWAQCNSQDHPLVRQYWQQDDVTNWYLSNTQWIYRIPNTNIVCSNTGISEKFLDNVCKYFKSKEGWDFNIYDTDQLIDHINDIEPCELFGFTPYRLSDYNGVKDIIHVVGYIPVNQICNLHTQKFIDTGFPEDAPDVWLCNCLMNGEYLIIEDGEFKPCRL